MLGLAPFAGLGASNGTFLQLSLFSFLLSVLSRDVELFHAADLRQASNSGAVNQLSLRKLRVSFRKSRRVVSLLLFRLYSSSHVRAKR